MSSKNQTAVEWLALYIKGITTLNCDEVIAKAKAIENEQIEAAYRAGYTDCSLDRFSDCEKYYTSTYE